MRHYLSMQRSIIFISSTPIWQQVLTVLELHFVVDCMRGRQYIPDRNVRKLLTGLDAVLFL